MPWAKGTAPTGLSYQVVFIFDFVLASRVRERPGRWCGRGLVLVGVGGVTG